MQRLFLYPNKFDRLVCPEFVLQKEKSFKMKDLLKAAQNENLDDVIECIKQGINVNTTKDM